MKEITVLTGYWGMDSKKLKLKISSTKKITLGDLIGTNFNPAKAVTSLPNSYSYGYTFSIYF